MLISEPEPTVPSMSSPRCCLLLLQISTIGWEAPGGTSQASWGNHFLFRGEGMLDWETTGWWWLQSIRTETRVQWLSKVGLKCAEGATRQICKAVEFHSETDNGGDKTHVGLWPAGLLLGWSVSLSSESDASVLISLPIILIRKRHTKSQQPAVTGTWI